MASALDDAKKLFERDPVAGFIAIAIAGARSPRPQIIVKLKGRSLVLPDWTGDEWKWYGALAIKYALAVTVKLAATDSSNVADINRARSNLDLPLRNMTALRDAKPNPTIAADFYDKSVRVVIAAHAAGTTAPTPIFDGPLFSDAVMTSLAEAPAVIGESLAAVLAAGGAVLIPVAKEAGKIASELFSQIVKGAFPILLVGGGLLLLYYLSKQKES